MIALLLSVFLLFPALAQAATYYVATTGSDSNNGTAVSTPFRSIQKCADRMVAGDLCTVADGTYTATDGGGIQSSGINVYIRSGSNAAGTAGAPITIRSTNLGGAIVTLASLNSANTGFRVSQPYWIIERFAITGGSATGSSASYAGITFTSAGSHGIARYNTIHHVARTVCSSSNFGMSGIYVSSNTDVIVERNLLYSIGRLRIGESGCALGPSGDGSNAAHDHGMYIEGTTNTTIRENVIYDTNRGYPIHVYKSGGTSTNFALYKNTIAGKSPTGVPIAQVILSATVSTCLIQDNLFYDTAISAITTFNLTATNCTVSYNKQNTDDTSGDNMFAVALPSGVTTANNTDNVALGFVNAGANDFTLAAGSTAINAGTAVSGLLCNGTCDLGRYETFGFSNATINATFLDVTMAMATNTPVVPALSGWSAACSGSNCGTPVVAAVALLAGTDSQVRLTLTGIGGTGVAAVGQTWTVSCSPCTSTDFFGQKATSFTTQAVTNAATSTTPPTFNPLSSSTFTGADENPLREGTGWSDNVGIGGMKRVSNSASPINDGQDAGARYTGGAAVTTNQYSCGDITTVGTVGVGQGMGLSVLNSASANTEYRFIIDHAASNNAELARVVAGAYTSLTRWTQAFTNADRFCFANEGAVLYVYDKNSLTTPVKTFDDTGNGGSTTGVPGIFYSSTETSALIDNWVGGNYYNTQTPPPPIAGTLTQKDHQLYEARTVAGSAVTLAALSAAATRLPGESFALTTQTDCTVADCDPLSLGLYYSRNGATFVPVPDLCAADHVCFYGPTGDATVLQGTVTCCLSGLLTPNDGTTQLTSAAVPVFDLAPNASTVHRFIVKFDTGALATDTYDFKTYNQTGTALTAYSPSGGARITINALASGLAAPASPHQVGPASGTLVGLVWAPVSYSMLGGYNIYQSTTSGVYSTNWTYQVTLAGAAAAHSPPTQLLTIIQTPCTCYFVVKAFSLDGTESAASAEVTIIVTGPPARTPRPQ